MLTGDQKVKATALLSKGTPAYRKAYSDRMGWLMAYVSELAYIRYEEAVGREEVVKEIALQIAKLYRMDKKNQAAKADRLISAATQELSLKPEDEKAKLKACLKEVGLELIEPISVKSTQCIVARKVPGGNLEAGGTDEPFAVLAFRGTEVDRIGDLLADLKASLEDCPSGGRIHSGFKKQYEDAEWEINKALDDEQVKGLPLYITGHSLGGAVATIAAKRLDKSRKIAACYTYGSPRVGTEEWAALMKTPVYRMVNSADPIPTVPMSGTFMIILAKVLKRVWIPAGEWVENNWSGYTHTGNMRFLTKAKNGRMSTVKVLYAVGWTRRFIGAVRSIGSVGLVAGFIKIGSNHGIKGYSLKLLTIGAKRNKENSPEAPEPEGGSR